MLEKYQKLIDKIKNYQKVIVAYSGGVDSSLVLKASVDALGKENVIAAIASSQLDERDISQSAAAQAEEIGSQWVIVPIDELKNEAIYRYSPDSWYHSKMMIYQAFNTIKEEQGYDVIMDGMIMDDLSDFRPGMVARNESGVVSILQKAHIYKSDVRQILKALDLEIWSKPSSCSLLSRFTYGSNITEDSLHRIRKGEEYLESLGFITNRVRVHEDLARIEVAFDQLRDLFEYRQQIQNYFSQLGFTYVTMDLRGYQSGRMNETLPEDVKEKYQV